MRNKNRLLWSAVAMAGMCHAAHVDLSDYTDLTDSLDDSAAFTLAIADAGDGGMVYIPAGTVVLDNAVQITNQTVSILGDGTSVTEILANFSNGSAALSFLSTAGFVGTCRWSVRDLTLRPDAAAVALAVSLQDERGHTGGSRMEMSNVNFDSGTKDYFRRGVAIDGMAFVEMETCKFVGELQDSVGEEPGHLTESHVFLTGMPSGRISMFLCHLRRTKRHFEINADFESLFLRQLNLVQCDAGIEQQPGVSGGWVYMHGCASQLGVPLECEGVDFVQITSSRFILDENTSLGSSVIMDQVDSSIVSGAFLKSGGILYQQCSNGVVFGNHGHEVVSQPEDVGGKIRIQDSAGFSLCNNYAQWGTSYYPGIYDVSGSSSNIRMVVKEVVQ